MDTTDHVAARRIEHRVREPRAVAEVVGMALQVCAVLPRRLPRIIAIRESRLPGKTTVWG